MEILIVWKRGKYFLNQIQYSFLGTKKIDTRSKKIDSSNNIAIFNEKF
jgi:hypothetical protein